MSRRWWLDEPWPCVSRRHGATLSQASRLWLASTHWLQRMSLRRCSSYPRRLLLAISQRPKTSLHESLRKPTALKVGYQVYRSLRWETICFRPRGVNRTSRSVHITYTSTALNSVSSITTTSLICSGTCFGYAFRKEYSSDWLYWLFCCRNHKAPSYLADELHWTDEAKSRHRLRSGSCPRLIVPRTRLSTIGDRSFHVTVARAWNSLPTSITALTSLPSFKRQLKTFLFTKSFPSV